MGVLPVSCISRRSVSLGSVFFLLLGLFRAYWMLLWGSRALLVSFWSCCHFLCIGSAFGRGQLAYMLSRSATQITRSRCCIFGLSVVFGSWFCFDCLGLLLWSDFSFFSCFFFRLCGLYLAYHWFGYAWVYLLWILDVLAWLLLHLPGCTLILLLRLLSWNKFYKYWKSRSVKNMQRETVNGDRLPAPKARHPRQMHAYCVASCRTQPVRDI